MYAQDNNSLPVWSIFVTSLLTHISINSQPFLVGIVSPQDKRRQSAILHKFLALQAGEREAEANGLAGFHGEEKKRASEYRAHNGQ